MRLAFASTGKPFAGEESGRERLAALTAASGEDGAARAGAHPEAETVGLRALAVVRLERSLAHINLRGMVASQACAERWGQQGRPGKLQGSRKGRKSTD